MFIGQPPKKFATASFNSNRGTHSVPYVAKLKIEQIWMNVYHGGKIPSPYDQHLFIDNVVIANKYIGPLHRK